MEPDCKQMKVDSTAPAGKACLYCGEPIEPSDDFRFESVVRQSGVEVCTAHRECSARQVLGSVGHLLGKCSCFGGKEEDPPGMTPRQAARAALDLARRIAKENELAAVQPQQARG